MVDVNSDAIAPNGAVVVERPEDAIAVITLNRPDKLNAMNASLVSALHVALKDVADDPSVRVLVLTGAGRAFCSGFDLNGYGALRGDGNRGHVQRDMAMQQHIARMIQRLRLVPQPIIAAVNGPATGGGMALALGADIRVAASSALFNAAFVHLGLSGTDVGVSWILPRIVGAGRANEIMLTGRFVDADEAERIGLVTAVVPDCDLRERAMADARRIAQHHPLATSTTKEGMWTALEITDLRSAMELESRGQVMLMQTEDHLEALKAYRAGRDPSLRDE